MLLFNNNINRFIHVSRKIASFRYYPPLLISSLSNQSKFQQQRQFSIKENVESVVRTQTGIFKWLSESTIVEYSQNFLLYIHDNTGLPWWATIISTTFLLRTTVTLPVAIYQYHIIAKLEKIKLQMPEIAEEVRKEMAVAIRLYKWDEKTAKITYNRSVYL